MKVTFPHMGYLWITVKSMLEYLGVEVVVPPPSTQRTLTLGAKHAPEFACMPLKLNLGNFMEAAELGADTIVMAGGCGPCRFGYYAQVEHTILRDLGYRYNLVVLEPPEKRAAELLKRIRYVTGSNSWWQIIKGIKFGFEKARAVDRLEKKAQKLRPRESQAGSTNTALAKALTIIDQAKTPAELPTAQEKATRELEKVPTSKEPLVRIGIVGEIYTLLDPFANLNLEHHLGRMGAEVERSIYLSEWINDHLFMGLVKGMRSSKDSRIAAVPYLNHFVGGHGQESVGSTVLYSRRGFDGVIQLFPFTCMPEIVAQSILPGVSFDLGIPVLTLIVDEQTGEAGVITRLEAFVDLLVRRKKQQKEVLAP